VKNLVVRREKKRKYLRGWRSHSWGRTGQHRRSGRKGGRGHVGYHKHKWSWTLKYEPKMYGKHGFTRPPEIVVKHKCINLDRLNEMISELVDKGFFEKIDNKILVNLPELGYTKLLGRGKITRPLLIKTLYASKIAIEKVEQTGGRVELLRGE